jgi:HK97 gp10 family phage protein
MAQTDIEDAFSGLAVLLGKAGVEAGVEAVHAAAQVYVQAIKAAAPVRLGTLRESIGIVPTKDGRLLVGPQKKTGYYGYFLEHGHRTAGPRRVKRSVGGRAHGQRGVVTQRTVPPQPWFEPAAQSVAAEAKQAAVAAFDNHVRGKDR